MTAWNGWYHVTGSTYGAWLPGDPRGWRSRGHKKHVDGDYRNPPPPGQDAGLHASAEDSLKEPAVHLSVDQRRTAGQALVEMLLHQEVELLVLSLDAVHLHALARFGALKARQALGRAKKHAWFELRAGGHEGKLWAKRGGVKPIVDRQHQVNTYGYILDHREKGAWVWSYKQGVYWK